MKVENRFIQKTYTRSVNVIISFKNSTPIINDDFFIKV